MKLLTILQNILQQQNIGRKDSSIEDSITEEEEKEEKNITYFYFPKYCYSITQEHLQNAKTILNKTRIIKVITGKLIRNAAYFADLMGNRIWNNEIDYEQLLWALRQKDDLKYCKCYVDTRESDLCEVIHLLTPKENSAMFRSFNVKFERLIMAVNPIPIEMGSKHLEPLMEVYVSYDFKTVFHLRKLTRNSNYIPYKYRHCRVSNLFNKQLISLRELRYQLIFGQTVMPIFSYDWIVKYSNDGLRNHLTTAFRDPKMYAAYDERCWTNDHDKIYNNIMSNLEICRCSETTPLPGQLNNYFDHQIYLDYNALRKHNCNTGGGYDHICNTELCQTYRSCVGARHLLLECKIR